MVSDGILLEGLIDPISMLHWDGLIASRDSSVTATVQQNRA